jgi:hypothetical protein
MAFDDDDDFDDRPRSRRRRHDDDEEDDDDRDERRGRRRYEDDEGEYDFRKRDEPHSGAGIASVVIAGLAGLAFLILIAVAGVMAQGQGGELDENSPETIVLGMALLADAALALIGVIVAIVGLAQKDRKKVSCILGVVINGLLLLGMSGLICIGIAMS